MRPLLQEQLQQQWQQATRAVCARVYAPYKDGTIYPQLVVACDDHLNRALLREFQPLNNQELDSTPFAKPAKNIENPRQTDAT